MQCGPSGLRVHLIDLCPLILKQDVCQLKKPALDRYLQRRPAVLALQVRVYSPITIVLVRSFLITFS